MGNLASNAVNGLIAAGVLNNMEVSLTPYFFASTFAESNMQGTLGHAAWRWLFYIEGAATIAFAFISILILPDFPENRYAGGFFFVDKLWSQG